MLRGTGFALAAKRRDGGETAHAEAAGPQWRRGMDDEGWRPEKSLGARSYKADFTAVTQALQVAAIEPTIDVEDRWMPPMGI